LDDFAPFESPNLLIQGAKRSLPEFESACKAFVDSCTHEVIRNYDPNTKEEIIKLRFHQRVPPVLRYRAHHIANDLRHALDQAFGDAAILLGRPDSKGIYFPFARSATDLDSQISRYCRKVDTKLIAFAKAFNPHYGGDDLLYGLSAIVGPNKHQRILRISLDDGGSMLNGDGLDIQGPARININKWSDLRNELEYARAWGGGHVYMQFAPVLQIVINTGEAPFSGPSSI
jgi:hypothetical protein